MTQEFHLGDILSVTTGKLVSPRLMDAVYDVLKFMTGVDHYTHQLPRACREVRPVIIAQHPALGSVTLDDVTTENWKDKLAEQVAVHGEWLTLTPMAHYDPTDPLLELASMTEAPIVVVKP